MYIKNHPDQARSLMLDFTTTLSGALDGTTVELIPNGLNVSGHCGHWIITLFDRGSSELRCHVLRYLKQAGGVTTAQ